MAEPSLEYIGSTLQRVQQEMGELRMAVRTNWDETRTMHDLLREDMHRTLAELHARIDGFDQRFTYFDEALGHLRQDVEKSLAGLRQDMNGQFAEIKALLTNGK